MKISLFLRSASEVRQIALQVIDIKGEKRGFVAEVGRR